MTKGEFDEGSSINPGRLTVTAGWLSFCDTFDMHPSRYLPQTDFATEESEFLWLDTH